MSQVGRGDLSKAYGGRAHRAGFLQTHSSEPLNIQANVHGLPDRLSCWGSRRRRKKTTKKELSPLKFLKEAFNQNGTCNGRQVVEFSVKLSSPKRTGSPAALELRAVRLVKTS